MKRTIQMFFLALAMQPLLGTLPAVAQTPVPVAPAPAPAAHSTGNAIWDHQKDIGLTDAQVARMKALAAALQQQFGALKAKDQAVSKELGGMIQSNASTPQIRAKLMEKYSIDADFQIDNIEFQRSMKKILTPDQLAKWSAYLQKNRTAPHPPMVMPPHH